ncbi:MAG: hypothetical protein CVV22_04710 [Ignavibacteriae bacterium HGW-Ignavibacteriae-1]|nr:MAG: hypothetical protein CVV22_04710 [Ignavibacteriae bacterium HGW-Ignavibacteriae-1]
MAEIKIEQKTQAWPWVLAGLVIAALLVYFLVFQEDDQYADAHTDANYTTNTRDENNLIGVRENNSAVADYVSYVENTKGRMGLDHTYTNDAFTKLIDATEDMADEVGYDADAELERAEQHHQMITVDAFETTHANHIRETADNIANVLQNIQKAKFPSLANDVQGLKSAAGAIKPDVQTLEQRDAVKNYFAKASDLLNKMN